MTALFIAQIYFCNKQLIMKKLWYFIITWILISIPVFIFAQPQHNNSAITQTTQTTNTNVLNEVIIIVK